MDELFLAELNERLITHFVAGRWRVPAGQRHRAVARAGGGRLGRIVCAEAADLERARAALARASGAGAAPDGAAMRAAIRDGARALAALRAAEGFAAEDPAPIEAPALPGPGPHALLSAAALPPGVLAGILIAGAQGGGLIWKPAPAAAASAHLMMRIIGPLAGGRLALLQGDHASGALLAHAAPLVWASPAPVPAGLPRPALSLSSAAPGRR